jgi:hypothetical protein
MPGNMPGTLPMPVRRVRNRSRQNVVCQVSDKLIYGLQLFPARRASGNDDSGRTNPVSTRKTSGEFDLGAALQCGIRIETAREPTTQSLLLSVPAMVR